MNKFEVARGIYISMLKRVIASINSDPDRSIRKVADVGIRVCRGDYQKRVFLTIQQTLERPDSPYYSLFKRLCAEVSPERLSTFLANFFYSSLTYGTDLNRSLEHKYGRFLPWSAVFHTEGKAGEETLFSRAAAEGRSLGIFAFIVLASDSGIKTAVSLAKEHPDCAFMVFLSPAGFLSNADSLAELNNCGMVIEYGPSAAAACAEARRRGFLYGVYTNTPSVGGSFYRDCAPLQPAAAITVANSGLSAQDKLRLAALAESARIDPVYPFVTSDFYSDIVAIDGIISNGPLFFGLMPDGEVTGYTPEGGEQPTGASLAGHTLCEILGVEHK